MNRNIIICGPTATGKSALGIFIASMLGTDIISVDSRQAFKDMDIGTGKNIPSDSQFTQLDEIFVDHQPYSIGFHIIDGVKHWLFDLALPSQSVNVGLYRAAYLKVIDILSTEKKKPILVGGTGFYLKSIIQPSATISIPPDKDLRSRLDQDSLVSLQRQLTKVNPTRWSTMNHSDQNNPRRLIRAIEVSQSTLITDTHQSNLPLTIWIGLTAPKEFLFQRIETSVNLRLQMGFIQEVEFLIRTIPNFLSLPSGKTLGYVNIGSYLQGDISKETAISDWIKSEHQYSKRQLTWFNQQPHILWFDITDKNWYDQVINKINQLNRS